ncbi:hypothetical protein [Komagataeibacter sp. FNDCF1]|nr:hypothetical protein [Komagataeibacter sp. FNDCF1]
MADKLYVHDIQDKTHGVKSYLYLMPVMTCRPWWSMRITGMAHP